MIHDENELNICLLDKKINTTSVHRIIQLIMIISWLMLLTNTNSYYVIYLLMGLSGLFCRNKVNKNIKAVFVRKNLLNLTISSFFSLLIIAANYDMFYSMIDTMYQSLSKHKQFIEVISLSQFKGYTHFLFYLSLPVMFLGGMYLTFFILQYLTDKAVSVSWKQNTLTLHASSVFIHSFAVISGFYILIFSLCFFPGIFCPDTITQVREITTEAYTNRNPFYHTMLLRVFISTGIRLFDDINIGAAIYSVSSVFFLSSSFAFSVTTLYQLKIEKKIIYFVMLFYMLMPYNILFSFNMWKDTPFNAFLLFFTVSVLRYLKKIGNEILNFILVMISCMGVCLFRGNGLIVIFVSLTVFIVLFRKSCMKLTLTMASVLAVSLIMTYPLLEFLNVPQSDVVELSSMPIQQIARTVIDYNDLSPEDEVLLEKVCDLNIVRVLYDPTLSDPLKTHIRSRNGHNYIKDHKNEYSSLYFRLGLKHPNSYIKAWIDQTRGYWNGGYDTVKYSYAFVSNSYGLKKCIVWEDGQKAVFLYATLYETIDLLKPFVSIGLHTWIIVLVAFIAYRKRDKIIMNATVPSLSIVFSLLLGTPVFSEFRYAYGLFCCLPFLMVSAFAKVSDVHSESSEQSLNP